MQPQYGNWQDEKGDAITSATCTVYLKDTLTLATIYSDDAGTPKSNPFTTDPTTGEWFFYAADGKYDVKLEKTTYASDNIYDLQCLDQETVYDMIDGAADGIKYHWDTAAERTAESGMSEGDLGMMTGSQDNIDDEIAGWVYQYISSTWTYKYTRMIDGAVWTTDQDLGGNYMIRNQSFLNQQPFPYYHFDGVSNYISVADDDDLDFGTDDFSFIIKFNSAFNHSASAGIFFDKGQPTARCNCYITTSNKIRITIYDAASETTIDSDNVLNDGNWHIIVGLADRSGYLKMYVDGILQTDVAACPSQTISNSQDFYLGRLSTSGSNYLNGSLSKILFFNRLPTDAEAKEFSSNQLKAIAYADEGASNTPIYASDFSADEDGWVATNGTVSGNNDAVSDGGTSYDNVLKYYADAANGAHNCYVASGLTVGKNRRLKLSIYIPSGQTHIDGFALAFGAAATTYVTGYGTTGAGNGVNGTWTDVLIDETTLVAGANLYVIGLDGSTISFVGANDSADDRIYVYAVEVFQIGATAVYMPRNAFPSVWRDSSGNGNHATVSGATRCNEPYDLLEDVDITIDAGKTLDGAGTFDLSGGTLTLADDQIPGDKILTSDGNNVVIYRLKTDIINSDDPLGASGGEWELADDTENEISFGTVLVTESNGIFSFTRTGIYKISYWGSLENETLADSLITVTLKATDDNSTYNQISSSRTSISAANYECNFYGCSIIDVEDTTLDKVKLVLTLGSALTHIMGDGSMTLTGICFERLGST